MMGKKEEEGGRTKRKGEGEKKRRKNLERRGKKAEGRQKDWLLIVAPSPGGHIYNPLPTKGRIGEFAVRSCLL